ncbi:MAG TPA: hypothetical protein VF265_10820 [Nevskiaceae bacterium]
MDDGAYTGVVAALWAEARCLTEIDAAIGAQAQLSGVRLRLAGMGAERAAKAAQKLLDDGAGALVSWGTCGALQSELFAGDVVLPHAVRDEAGTVYDTDARWRTRVRAALSPELGSAHEGVLLSAARPWATAAEKRRGGAAGAAVVDMESAAVARVALDVGVPFLAIRVIVDAVDVTIPSAAIAGVDTLGRVRPWPFALQLLRRPGQLMRLPRLGRDFAKATDGLHSIAATCLPAIASASVRHA